MTMHRLLGSVLPVVVLVVVPAGALAGCGDDDSSAVVADPAPTSATASSPPGESPSQEPSGYQLVDTITVTAAGGAVSPIAIPLTDEASVQGFVAQFTSDDLSQQVQDAVAATQVTEGQ